MGANEQSNPKVSYFSDEAIKVTHYQNNNNNIIIIIIIIIITHIYTHNFLSFLLDAPQLINVTCIYV
jgi:hypothetical protein